MKNKLVHCGFLIALAMTMVMLGGCRSGRGGREPRPDWVAQPKNPDTQFFYVVGAARGGISESAAREAAFQNAVEQIARKIGGPNPAALAGKAEIVPDCIHLEERDSRYDAWVQVSWPKVETEKLLNPASGNKPGVIIQQIQQ